MNRGTPACSITVPRWLALGCAILALAALATTAIAEPGTNRVDLEDDLFVEPVAPGIWRHVTIRNLNGITFGSNGLIVSAGDGAVLIDTPWGAEETRVLLDWIASRLGPVRVVIGTHAHEDRVIGLEVAARAGVETLTSRDTHALSVERGLPLARRTQTPPMDLGQFGVAGEVYFPGPGHSADNVVVWLAQSRILFGGCLVRSGGARGIGYTADADLAGWPESIAALQERYPEVRIVVPGHGDPGDRSLLDHTRALLARHGHPGDERP